MKQSDGWGRGGGKGGGGWEWVANSKRDCLLRDLVGSSPTFFLLFYLIATGFAPKGEEVSRSDGMNPCKKYKQIII